MMNDSVNHPSHYTKGGIECIDALTAMISGYTDPNDAALSWQVGKYVWRHPFKNNPIEDLKKARYYLERLIEHLESKEAEKRPAPCYEEDAADPVEERSQLMYEKMRRDFYARKEQGL